MAYKVIMDAKSNMDHYVIQDVTIWNADGVAEHQDLAIAHHRVQSIQDTKPDQNHGTTQVIDGKGLTLLPAGIDLHVHLRVPGQPEKETPETGLKAAMHGGYGVVMTMPNTYPVIDGLEALEEGRAQMQAWEEKTGVQVYWTSCITERMDGQKCVDFDAMAQAGVRAFTDDGKGVDSDDVMREALAYSAASGMPILQHAEFSGHGGVIAPCDVQKKLKVGAYPAEPEWTMVERDLQLLESFPKARYHVLHISSEKTVALLRQAQAKGLQATGEVTPHHLYFDVTAINPDNPSFKMNPPLREASDQAFLWEGLRDGTLSYMATDHAPHEPAAKPKDFGCCAFGTTGLETGLRVLLDGYQKGWLSPPRLVEVFSTQPAAFLHLQDTHGKIEVGRPFYAVLVDAQAQPKPIGPDDLQSKSKNNVFLGAPLAGQIKQVFLSHARDSQ